MSDELMPYAPESEEPARDEPAKEEIASASEVLHAMLKTSKAFRIYLPNNPLLQKFIEETYRRISDHIEKYDAYRLEVEPFEFRYRGVRIHENRDPKESFPFRMYSDGIRLFIFEQGIESSEICDVLDIIGRDRLVDSDDDIVTLLWVKDLQHVSYILTEEILETDFSGDVFPRPRAQSGAIRLMDEDDSPSVAPEPRELFVLEPGELAKLAEEQQAEERRSPHQEVVTVITSILAGEEDAGLVRDFVEIMDNLIANLIHAGRAQAALKLVRLLKKMAAAPSLKPEKRVVIGAAAGSTINGDTVLSLLPSLDCENPLTPEEASEFFDFFGARHCAALVDLLAQVQSMKIRKAVLGALVRLGRDNPSAFIPFLSDKRWFLVRNIIFILGHFDYPEAVDPVARLAGHPEQRVRKEVLTYLQKRSEPRTRTAIVRFLQDGDAHLRVRALQALAAARFHPALRTVEAMAAAKDFTDRAPAEKTAIYEAIGQLAGDSVVPRMREMLRKRFLVGKSKDREAVVCAVAALRRIRTPGALRVLEEAEAERRGSDLSMLIADALREVSADMPQA